MILGVGIDIADVQWVREQLARAPEWVEHHFTRLERAQAQRREPWDVPRALAARWAAKEAVVKAIGGALRGERPPLANVDWREIEVVVDRWGCPAVALHGAMASLAASWGPHRWHVSLTHEGDTAAAVAVVERVAGAPSPPPA